MLILGDLLSGIFSISLLQLGVTVLTYPAAFLITLLACTACPYLRVRTDLKLKTDTSYGTQLKLTR